MPRIGKFHSKHGGYWEHPEFPNSKFRQLTATAGSDVLWNETPRQINFGDEVFEELMADMEEISQSAAEAGDGYGVKTEYGWFSFDPRKQDLYVLIGLSDRHPFGSVELMLFERLDKDET